MEETKDIQSLVNILIEHKTLEEQTDAARKLWHIALDEKEKLKGINGLKKGTLKILNSSINSRGDRV